MPASKVKEYAAKLSKRELKYFINYNYGYLSSKNKDEVYQDLNKHTIKGLIKYAINKHQQQQL